jgi:hypothetical protein
MVLIVLQVEDLVNCQFEHVINHPRNQHLQDRTAFLDGRIGVYLDQPYLIGFIDHEIIAKELKTVLSTVDVDFAACRTHGKPNHLSDFGLYSDVGGIIREVFLELSERNLIS